jgi:glycosyltransferase involved in cell wall biosynthesis
VNSGIGGLSRIAGGLRRHWFFAALFGCGVVLRVVTWLAYQPIILYIDSFRYIDNLGPLELYRLNPVGYDLMLRPVLFVGELFGSGLALTAAVQHLLGLCIAVVLYRLARGLGAARFVAALITAPVLLDAYQLQIEQNLMAEAWSDALLVGAVWLLLGWRMRPRRRPAVLGPHAWQAAAAGVLIGVNVPVRVVGLLAVIPFLAYLILAGAGWRDRAWRRQMLRRLGAGIAGFGIIVGSYVGVFRAVSGHWGLSGGGGEMLYGRAATVANCQKLDLDKYLAQLCPRQPPDQRPGVDTYAHADYNAHVLPPHTTQQQLKREFGLRVLQRQPLDVVRAVLRDFGKGFAWTRTTSHNDVPLSRWQFQVDYPRWKGTDADKVTRFFDHTNPHVIKPLTRFLRGYQLGGGYTPGTLLGLAGAVGVAGIFRRRGRLRAESVLAVGIPLLLLGGAAGFEFSWRYQLPGLVFFPLAGAVGFTALTRRLRQPLAPYPDATDRAAVADFEQRYGDVRLAPVVVVIAAYNEEHGIDPVLERIPASCPTPDGETLPVATLVVVDGATDHTADVVAGHHAYVLVAPNNRGQGGALRLGYRLATDHGAAYIVTADGDGQYDIDELPQLLNPILTGRADFVTGSRRLGHEESDSHMRWVGVRVFAALASLLTHRRITDTSFGFRAMRAELVRQVRLTEPQYQASELLIGVLARGARVVELGLTMRLRTDGGSKKGGSLAYGAGYARAMVNAWYREWLGSSQNRRLRRRARRNARRLASTGPNRTGGPPASQ